MKILDLGCGKNKIKESIGIDISEYSDADIIHDLNKFPYPFNDNEFDFINADNVLEHLVDIVKVMEELHRITKNGSIIKIIVPFFRSDYSFIDPTHKHFFTYRSFDYFDPNKEFNNKYKYSFCLFKINKIIFDENLPHNIMGKLFVSIANKYPLFYENKISRIIALDTLNYYLETIK